MFKPCSPREFVKASQTKTNVQTLNVVHLLDKNEKKRNSLDIPGEEKEHVIQHFMPKENEASYLKYF